MTLRLHEGWEALQAQLFFLPSLPETLDPLALLALLLAGGLIVGEALGRSLGLSRLVGYVLAGVLAGPAGFGWLDRETLTLAKPVADLALGLLLLETGRHLEVGWLRANPGLLLSAALEAGLACAAIFLFAWRVVELSPAWSAAAAVITMTSAPAVVLLTSEENHAQGQVTQRTLLLTALNCGIAFTLFALVLGALHAEQSGNWLNALLHPLWVIGGSVFIGLAAAHLAIFAAARYAKGSAGQVFVLVALALLAVGLARMLAVPVFLSLFLMGAAIQQRDRRKVLAYTSLPQGHWILAIVLFVISGAMLPLAELNLATALQAGGLLLVRGLAKFAGVIASGRGDLPFAKRCLVGIGMQPLSATAIFMAAEVAALYPESSAGPLQLPLLAAALMAFVGPPLCKYAFRKAGENAPATPGRRP